MKNVLFVLFFLVPAQAAAADCAVKEYAQYKDEIKRGVGQTMMPHEYCHALSMAKINSEGAIKKEQLIPEYQKLSGTRRDVEMLREEIAALNKAATQCSAEAEKMYGAIMSASKKSKVPKCDGAIAATQ
ncbi:MAG TPA: hypothetical protein VF928_09330 [Usitatibacteraceae bacterium]